MSEQLSGLLYSTDNKPGHGRVAGVQLRLSDAAADRCPVRADVEPAGPVRRVISRELGDRISVTRSLEGVDIDVDAVIGGIQHVFDRRQWDVVELVAVDLQFGPGGGNNNYRYLRLANTVVGDADDNGAMLASNPPVDTDNRLGN